MAKNKTKPRINYLNEADVEIKFVSKLLMDTNKLSYPPDSVKPKQYLAPSIIDKRAGRVTGYFPDFSVWLDGMPVLVVEVKDPEVAAEVGFREACLYARHLNSKYSSGLNPCHFVIATNGAVLLAGLWDQEQPILNCVCEHLDPNSAPLTRLIEFCGIERLRAHTLTCTRRLRVAVGTPPYKFAGGAAILTAKRDLNSFAADLSPILRRYFSSKNDENEKEIAQFAYVTSAEVTEYDRVLEALLKDRIGPRRDTLVKPICTTKGEEPLLTRELERYAQSGMGGQIQIIQGAVGAGKSIFVLRYRDLLEPPELKAVNYWAFINFNDSPRHLNGAEAWMSEAFIKSLEVENPELDLYEKSTLRGIFSRKIQQRKAYYAELAEFDRAKEAIIRAEDIEEWRKDPMEFSQSIGEYIGGVLRRNLIVIMDNVDKLDLKTQIDAFQLALWFMARAKPFIVLQMRDETYERFKNKPPLDTFRSGITFHISSPRFVDVVKKRLELGIQYLARNSAETTEYTLDNGFQVILPRGELGRFLHTLYVLVFAKRGNSARVLESLAGRDVRKALDMFVSIVTSGHLSTSAITSNVRGQGDFPISEYQIIRILMRTDYTFFSDASGYMSNIFHYDNRWERPDNFILIEVLFFLCMNRKVQGEIGVEGYFSVRRMVDELGKIGYIASDVHGAVNYLLGRELIIADNLNFTEVSMDECVRVQASGFMHLRVLSERIEYISGVLPVTPVSNEIVARQLGEHVTREVQREPTLADQVHSVELFHSFLTEDAAKLRIHNPFFDPRTSGAHYVLSAMDRSIRHYYKIDDRTRYEPNPLDVM